MAFIGFYSILAFCVIIFIAFSFRFKFFALCFTAFMLPAFPFFADTHDWIWFDWSKRYSVLLITLLICLVQYLHQRNPHTRNRLIRWTTLYILPFVLFANILEGTLVDFFSKNYLNVIVAALLIATIPNFWAKWYIDKDNILGFGSYWDWCILYTTWNAYLVVCNGGTVFQNIYIPALIILVINLLACLLARNWHIWFATRAYCIFLIASIDSFFPSLLPNIQLTFSTEILKIWGIFNIIFAGFLIYRTFKEKRSCFIWSYPTKRSY